MPKSNVLTAQVGHSRKPGRRRGRLHQRIGGFEGLPGHPDLTKKWDDAPPLNHAPVHLRRSDQNTGQGATFPNAGSKTPRAKSFASRPTSRNV